MKLAKGFELIKVIKDNENSIISKYKIGVRRKLKMLLEKKGLKMSLRRIENLLNFFQDVNWIKYGVDQNYNFEVKIIDQEKINLRIKQNRINF